MITIEEAILETIGARRRNEKAYSEADRVAFLRKEFSRRPDVFKPGDLVRGREGGSVRSDVVCIVMETRTSAGFNAFFMVNDSYRPEPDMLVMVPRAVSSGPEEGSLAGARIWVSSFDFEPYAAPIDPAPAQ